jgi:chromosomal replication initiation ATPase DnaA
MRGDPEIVDIEHRAHERVVQFSLWRGPITGRRWLMTEIVTEVSAAYGITRADLMGRNKRRKPSIARHHAMWLMRLTPGRSLTRIGQFFGVDHTTIHHGVRAHEGRLENRRYIETERVA